MPSCLAKVAARPIIIFHGIALYVHICYTRKQCSGEHNPHDEDDDAQPVNLLVQAYRRV